MVVSLVTLSRFEFWLTILDLVANSTSCSNLFTLGRLQGLRFEVLNQAVDLGVKVFSCGWI